MQVSSGQVNSRGTRLAYEEWGRRGAPTLVLLHGLTEQRQGWSPFPAALAASRHLVVPDTRGHGESDWAASGYALELLVADLLTVLDDAQVEACHLVGHSMGGRVALAFAARFPARVKGLMLIDSAPEFSARMNGSVRSLLETRAIGFSSREHAAEHYRRTFPGWRSGFYGHYARQQTRLNWAGKYELKWHPSLFWLTGSAGAKDTPALWTDAARLSCPTSLIYGVNETGGLDDDIVARFVAAVPRLDVIKCAAGHHPFREQPAEILQHISRFAGCSEAETEAAGATLQGLLNSLFG